MRKREKRLETRDLLLEDVKCELFSFHYFFYFGDADLSMLT